jgi:hypothetical protein
MKEMPDTYRDLASVVGEKMNTHDFERPPLHARAVYGTFGSYQPHQVSASTMLQHDE